MADKPFNLRQTHEHPAAFDAALGVCACLGMLMVVVGLRFRGGWDVVGFLGFVGLVILALAVLVEPKMLRVTRLRRALVAEPKAWINIVFLSDLHAGSFRPPEWFDRIAREAQALKPDLILLGGDYVSDLADPVRDLKGLEVVSAPLGKYFVLGNHDLLDRPQEIRKALVGFGFEDLTNRSVMIERHGRMMELQGLDDHWHGMPCLFKRHSPQTPHLTLAHEPDAVLDLTEGDTDLVLAGHTHGGQVRLPLVGPLWPVPAILGRAVDRGLKIIHGVPVVISHGLGETDSRARLGTPPEIIVIEAGI